MPRLYNVPDVATILKVKPSTVYTWVDKGKIPHIRIGRLMRFTEDQINDFLRGATEEG
jgi:excisionase family DNA binding protein